AFTQQSVIDEHTSQLITHRFVDKHGDYGGINAAAQRTEYLLVTDLRPDILDRILDECLHAPVAFTSAHFIQEVADHFVAMYGVAYLRMELDAVQPALFVREASERSVLRRCIDDEAFRQFHDMVAMAHPYRLLRLQAFRECRMFGEIHVCLPVFALSRTFYLSAELMRHQLHSVTNPENRHTDVIYSRVDLRCIFCIHTVRTAREDDALRGHFPQPLCRSIVWQQFAVYT